jgi:hypothetical protein
MTPCSKVPYNTKRAAKRGRKRHPHAASQRPYRCRQCGEWHLTSMTLTEQEARSL